MWNTENVDCKYLSNNLQVIGFYYGEFKIVVGNDQESVREILKNQDLDGRPDTLTGRLRDPNFNLRGSN